MTVRRTAQRAVPTSTERHQYDPDADESSADRQLQRKFFAKHDRRGDTNDEDAQTLKRVEVAEIETLEQPEREEKRDRHEEDAAAQQQDKASSSPVSPRCGFHRVLQKKLT